MSELLLRLHNEEAAAGSSISECFCEWVKSIPDLSTAIGKQLRVWVNDALNEQADPRLWELASDYFPEPEPKE